MEQHKTNTETEVGNVRGTSESPITIEDEEHEQLTETQRLQFRTDIINSTIVLDNERYMTATASTLNDMKTEAFDRTNMYVRTTEGGEVKKEPITITDSDDEYDEIDGRSNRGTKRTRFGI